jgi:hypothetical protein
MSNIIGILLQVLNGQIPSDRMFAIFQEFLIIRLHDTKEEEVSLPIITLSPRATISVSDLADHGDSGPSSIRHDFFLRESEFKNSNPC